MNERQIWFVTGASSGFGRAITEAAMHPEAEKGRPVHDLERTAATLRDRVVVLTGCRKGHVRRALEAGGPAAAARALDRLVGLFGAESVAVELTDHGLPIDVDPFVMLFSESSGRVLVSVHPDVEEDLVGLCAEADIHQHRLGTVRDVADAELHIAGQLILPLADIRQAWSAPLREVFAN